MPIKENTLIKSHAPAQVQSDWVPAQGWMLMTPVKLPNKTESGLLIPDTVTKKANSGLCVRVHGNTEYDVEDYLGKEILFANNSQYDVRDTDTGEEFYILPLNQVILTRVPPKPAEFYRVPEPALKEEGHGMTRGGLATLQQNKD